MAETFFLAQYVDDTNALVSDALKTHAADKGDLQEAAGVAQGDARRLRRSVYRRGPRSITWGATKAEDDAWEGPRDLWPSGRDDDPIMRRASWVEAPLAVHDTAAAGFGLPRTPLRVLSSIGRGLRTPVQHVVPEHAQQLSKKKGRADRGHEPAPVTAATTTVAVAVASGDAVPRAPEGGQSLALRVMRGAWGPTMTTEPRGTGRLASRQQLHNAGRLTSPLVVSEVEVSLQRSLWPAAGTSPDCPQSLGDATSVVRMNGDALTKDDVTWSPGGFDGNGGGGGDSVVANGWTGLSCKNATTALETQQAATAVGAVVYSGAISSVRVPPQSDATLIAGAMDGVDSGPSASPPVMVDCDLTTATAAVASILLSATDVNADAVTPDLVSKPGAPVGSMSDLQRSYGMALAHSSTMASADNHLVSALGTWHVPRPPLCPSGNGWQRQTSGRLRLLLPGQVRGAEGAPADDDGATTTTSATHQSESAEMEYYVNTKGVTRAHPRAVSKELEWWIMSSQDYAHGVSIEKEEAVGSLQRRRRHWQRGNTAGDTQAVSAATEELSTIIGRRRSNAGATSVRFLSYGAVAREATGERRGGVGTLRLGVGVKSRLPKLDDVAVFIDKCLPLFLPSNFRDCWDALLLFLLLYTAAMVPLQAGFQNIHAKVLDAVDVGILVIFWLDMSVQFRSAYISNEGELVRNTKQIARNYCRTWFLLDLISSMPWAEVLQVVLADSNSQVGPLLTLLRLFRLLKLIRLLRFLDRFRYANYLRLGRLFTLMLFVAHWTCCAWHGLAEGLESWPWLFDSMRNIEDKSFLTEYSLVLYSSFVLVVGSDNLTASNNVERVFFICMLIIGAIIYALIVSNMAVLAANLNALSSRYSVKANVVSDALRYVRAPQCLRDRVSAYYEFVSRHEHPGPEADAFLAELPRGLSEEIKWCLFSGPFYQLALFAGCDEPFMAALQSRLTLAAFTPGEEIFREGDSSNKMYLVRQGAVLLRCSQGDLQRLVMPGQAFSELALLPDLTARRQTCTAIAGLATDLVALAGRDLEVACREHPQSGALVQERLMQLLEDRVEGREWTWFVEKVLVPYQLYGDTDPHCHRERGYNFGGGGGGGIDSTTAVVPNSRTVSFVRGLQEVHQSISMDDDGIPGAAANTAADVANDAGASTKGTDVANKPAASLHTRDEPIAERSALTYLVSDAEAKAEAVAATPASISATAGVGRVRGAWADIGAQLTALPPPPSPLRSSSAGNTSTSANSHCKTSVALQSAEVPTNANTRVMTRSPGHLTAHATATAASTAPLSAAALEVPVACGSWDDSTIFKSTPCRCQASLITGAELDSHPPAADPRHFATGDNVLAGVAPLQPSPVCSSTPQPPLLTPDCGTVQHCAAAAGAAFAAISGGTDVSGASRPASIDIIPQTSLLLQPPGVMPIACEEDSECGAGDRAPGGRGSGHGSSTGCQRPSTELSDLLTTQSPPMPPERRQLVRGGGGTAAGSGRSLGSSRRLLRNVSDILGSFLDRVWGGGAGGDGGSFPAGDSLPGRVPNVVQQGQAGVEDSATPAATTSTAPQRLLSRRRRSSQQAASYLWPVNMDAPAAAAVVEPLPEDASRSGYINDTGSQGDRNCVRPVSNALEGVLDDVELQEPSLMQLRPTVVESSTAQPTSPTVPRRPPKSESSNPYTRSIAVVHSLMRPNVEEADGGHRERTSGSSVDTVRAAAKSVAEDDVGGAGGGLRSLVLHRLRGYARTTSNRSVGGSGSGAVSTASNRRLAGILSEDFSEGSVPHFASRFQPCRASGNVTLPSAVDGGGRGMPPHASTAPHHLPPEALLASGQFDVRTQLQAALMLLAQVLGVEMQKNGGACAGPPSAPEPPPPAPFVKLNAGSAAPAAPFPTNGVAEALLAKPCSRRLLVALADAVVRREGAAVPSVSELLQRHGDGVKAAVEERLGKLLVGVAEHVESVEQSVGNLNDSLGAANRRLAGIERSALNAESEGVLTGGLLRHLSRDASRVLDRPSTSDDSDDDSMFREDDGVEVISGTSAASGGGGGGDDLGPFTATLLRLPLPLSHSMDVDSYSKGTTMGFKGDENDVSLHKRTGSDIGSAAVLHSRDLRRPARRTFARPVSRGNNGSEATESGQLVGFVRKSSSGVVDAAVVPVASGGVVISTTAARRRSLDASGFSWLQQEWRNASQSLIPSGNGGGGDSLDDGTPVEMNGVPQASVMSARERRLSQRTSQGLLDLPVVGSGSIGGGAGGMDAGALAPTYYSQLSLPLNVGSSSSRQFPLSSGQVQSQGQTLRAQSRGEKARRASFVMLQAGLLSADAALVGPGGVLSPTPTQPGTILPSRQRRSSFAVLDDRVVQDGGPAVVGSGGSVPSGGARHTSNHGIAPSERPGARRMTTLPAQSGAPLSGSQQYARCRKSTSEIQCAEAAAAALTTAFGRGLTSIGSSVTGGQATSSGPHTFGQSHSLGNGTMNSGGGDISVHGGGSRRSGGGGDTSVHGPGNRRGGGGGDTSVHGGISYRGGGGGDTSINGPGYQRCSGGVGGTGGGGGGELSGYFTMSRPDSRSTSRHASRPSSRRASRAEGSRPVSRRASRAGDSRVVSRRASQASLGCVSGSEDVQADPGEQLQPKGSKGLNG